MRSVISPSHKTGAFHASPGRRCCQSVGARYLAGPATGYPTSSTPALPRGFSDFSDGSLPAFSVSVLGDLHLAPDQMPLFNTAKEQLCAAMRNADDALKPGARVVQLGDLGNGKHKPGSRQCFEFARDYLHSFGVPSTLVLGNHDLEGTDFESDEENLAAWRDVFQQPHHWCVELGPAIAIGISTTRYRSNEFCVHEVHIDEAQMAWLEDRLKAYAGRPVVIFTHAPPMGCGLKVLQEIHVKNRVAWLNHTDRPERFMELVARHPNIRLWFSGHFHLSHNYVDSISAVGSTAFVQTGVIGTCNRDGNRQSRLLNGNGEGYQLYTLDHETGQLRLDLAQAWADRSVPAPVTPQEEIICDPSAGWLCSAWDCAITPGQAGSTWFPAGRQSLLQHQDHLLIEYDMAYSAPIGLVARDLTEDSQVRMIREDGSPSVAEDGSDAAAVEVVEPRRGETRRFPRNEAGCFYQVFVPNKWKLAREKLQQETVLATAMAKEPAEGAVAAAGLGSEAQRELVSH